MKEVEIREGLVTGTLVVVRRDSLDKLIEELKQARILLAEKIAK